MTFSKKQNFKIVFTAVLIALNVVFERFLTFQIESNHYSLSVITVAFAAVFLGIPYAAAVAGVGDIVGALIFPVGPYFPGFTLSNILAAFCIAFFIKKRVTIWRAAVGVIIDKILITLILNSIFISILYKGGIDAFPAYLITRIPQAAIMTVIETLLIVMLFHEKSKVRQALNRIFLLVM